MIAGRDGLGFAVMDSRNDGMDMLVAEMIVIGLIGGRARSCAGAPDQDSTVSGGDMRDRPFRLERVSHSIRRGWKCCATFR